MAKNSNYISHCVAVQMIVNGTGSLHTTLYSLNGLNSSALPAIIMSESTDKFAVALANFRSQRMQVEVKTDAINEYFRISKITAFVKPSASGYPQP